LSGSTAMHDLPVWSGGECNMPLHARPRTRRGASRPARHGDVARARRRRRRPPVARRRRGAGPQRGRPPPVPPRPPPPPPSPRPHGAAYFRGGRGGMAQPDPPLGQALTALPMVLTNANPRWTGTLYDHSRPRESVLFLTALWRSILFLPAVGIAFAWCRRLY